MLEARGQNSAGRNQIPGSEIVFCSIHFKGRKIRLVLIPSNFVMTFAHIDAQCHGIGAEPLSCTLTSLWLTWAQFPLWFWPMWHDLWYLGCEKLTSTLILYVDRNYVRPSTLFPQYNHLHSHLHGYLDRKDICSPLLCIISRQWCGDIETKREIDIHIFQRSVTLFIIQLVADVFRHVLVCTRHLKPVLY